MQDIVSAALSEDATAADFSGIRIPESYRGAVVRKADVGIFEGMATADKDPRKALRVQDVPTPEPDLGEVLVAVMASSVNYNTVWSSIFEPLPTFGFMERYGRLNERTPDPKEWRRFGARIRELTGGEDVDIVFEHPGRETFGASVYVARKDGTVVTCASPSGYRHEYDNHYLWMSLKRIVGSHFAYYREAWEANRLVSKGRIHPTLSKVFPLDEVGEAVHEVHRNLHQGKVGVLCLAPAEGLGVLAPQLRARHLDAINRFRVAGA